MVFPPRLTRAKVPVAELSKLPVGQQHRVLHEILGIAAITGHPPGTAAQHAQQRDGIALDRAVNSASRSPDSPEARGVEFAQEGIRRVNPLPDRCHADL
jgi:hypothetical protein